MGLLFWEGSSYVDVEYDAAVELTEDFGGQQVAESFKTCWFFFVALHFSLDE